MGELIVDNLQEYLNPKPVFKLDKIEFLKTEKDNLDVNIIQKKENQSENKNVKKSDGN